MNSADTFGGAEEVLRALTAGFAPDPSLDGLAIGRPAPGSVLAGIRGGTVSHGSHSFHESCDGCPSPRHPARRVVFMKATQVEATEAGNNWIGFCMHRAPGPLRAVQPTVDLAKRLSQRNSGSIR